MTRDEKAQAAYWLRERGYVLRDIAGLLGYANHGSAWKILNTEAAKRREADDNARRGPAKRAWENEHDRHACPCGALRSPGAHRTARDGLCRTCRDEVRAVGTAMYRERIWGLWCAGTRTAGIAEALGTTANTINVELTRMRAAGWDVPYRRAAWTKRAVA